MSATRLPDPPKRSFRAARRRVGDRFVIVKQGRIFMLSEFADAVWRLIDGVRTIEEIAAGIQPTLELGAEDALAVARAALEKLAVQGLLEG